ncbi:MAG TPA: SAM-dependent chlorinase/fluorinase [Thermoanaerobaculia bacterium]|nr:SAM-dependent chlorinase/fluorinase [Thermoanaerobaculia bacterium]
MGILTLLTDFGTEDYYVAAVKGTVLSRAPGTEIVDVSHQVPPGDVETAAFLLAAAAPAFPAGTVHLAVVDPGVGSGRRILLARTDRALYLAPDNGLLTPFLPGARKVWSVEREDLFLPGPGRTVHGRDRFAPVAAALLCGEPPEAMGPEIADPRRLPGEPPHREPGRLTGRVVHVDRYGNLVTDIPAGWLPGGLCRFSVGSRSTTLFATHYAEIPPGEPAALPGSLGTIELSLRGDDLARRWGVERGAPVNVAWRPDSLEQKEL